MIKYYLSLILLATFSVPAMANIGGSNTCGFWANVDVSLTVDSKGLSPQTFYVKQGDRVCITLQSVGVARIGLEKHPLLMTSTGKKVTVQEFRASNKGTFEFKCNSCWTSPKAFLVVEDPATFNKREEELRKKFEKYDRLDSIQKRRY